MKTILAVLIICFFAPLAGAQYTPIPNEGGAAFRADVNNRFSGAVPITPMIIGSIVNGVANAVAFGAVGDGVTDNTTKIKNAVASLATNNGGIVYFPSAPSTYNFSGTIIMPKNVILQCAGDSAALNYTGTSGAALAWSDSTVNSYRRGGWNNCVLQGPGSGTSTIGIYTGGDPASLITPSANYGDFLSFFNGKVTGFGTAYQTGNNVWENRFYGTIFTGNGVGYNIPSNVTQTGENMGFYGGAIQNGTTGITCNMGNADLLFSGVSFDGLSSSVLVAGTSGSVVGCGVTFDAPHIEYFNGQLHPLAVPIFSVYGSTPFTNVHINGGVLQLDDLTTPTIQSFAKLTGGASTAAFSVDRFRISNNTTGGITYTATCVLSSAEMCIEGTANEAQYAEIGSYNYWNAGAQGVIPSTGGRAKSIWPCSIFSTTATTDTPHCAFKFGSNGLTSPNVPFFDTFAVTYQGSCTGYPGFEVYDVTTAAAVTGSTAANTNTTVTQNLAAFGTSPTDTYAIKTTTSANTCTAGSLFEINVSTRQ